MAWYKTGTITVTNGSETVIGSGTAWILNAAVGEALYAPDGRLYEITNIASDTAFTIAPAYLGATAAGASYVIVPSQSYIRDLAAQAADLVNQYSTIAAFAGQGKFGDGTLSAPGIRYSDDLDTGFFRSAANEVTFVAGGVAQFKYNASGLVFTGATSAVNLSYTGTLTGGTGVINIGSGQVYKDASGNVGIGTSSPFFGLDIQRPNSSTLNIYNTTATSNDSVEAQVSSFNGTYWNVISHNASSYRWKTFNGERMRLDSSGNLLVGTASATNSTNTFFRSSGAIQTNQSGSTTSQFQIIFANPNGNVGNIATDGTSTSYNTSSDYRLKEDAQPVLNPIDRLMQLKPINFAWKVDGSRTDGFLAHEAQEVVPEAVTGQKDAVDKDGKPEYQGIDQSKLVPLLTAALQDAIKRIEQLESQINSGV